MKRIAILGATGSIGRSTTDLVAQHPDRFRVGAVVDGIPGGETYFKLGVAIEGGSL